MLAKYSCSGGGLILLLYHKSKYIYSQWNKWSSASEVGLYDLCDAVIITPSFVLKESFLSPSLCAPSNI